ncbi:MAG: AMP-binding protein [Rhodobacteraceae bacterium]|nr:AMP-binding protein [Paracoccaceae bacterium]
MNIGIWLRRSALRHPSRPALFLGRRQVADYAGFDGAAAALAGWLVARGVRPGDRVAMFLTNCPDYLITLYAVWYAGAVAVPINARLHGREAAFILADSGATLCFCSGAQMDELRGAETGCDLIDVSAPGFAAACAHPAPAEPVARGADDLAWLFYTSGTTGRPKGVMITHGMLVAMSLSYPLDVDVPGASDAAIYAAPLSHGAGIYNMIHVRVGARHVCPESGGFDPAEVFDLAGFFGNAHMFAAPTMVKRMTDAARATGATGRGLRTVVYGGGPMYMADIEAATACFGPVFAQIYGQGECPMGISALTRDEVADRESPDWRARLAGVGRAQSAVEVAIHDPEGIPQPPGTAGEIVVRGAVVMPGYWRNPQATASALADGWLRTGDIGVLDARGYLTLQDRSKDMIITGGSNVYPREVEEVLLTHPQVSEVSVVGRPHAEWGEEIVAFVVGEASAQDLDALCLAAIARYKRPRTYRFVPALPKNNYGKVLKTELRAALAAPDGAA